MKNTTRKVYVIALLACSLSANGQWKLSPYIGANLSTVRFIDPPLGDDFVDQKPLFTGVDMGALIAYQWSEKWRVTTGLAIAQRGYKAQFSVNNDSISLRTETQLSLTYFEMPVMLEYQLWENKKHQLRLQAGAYLGIGATGRYESKTSVSPKTGNAPVTIEESREIGISFVQSINPGNVGQLSQNQLFVQKLRAGVSAGLHYQYQKWGVSVRYLQQLTNIHSPIKPEGASLFEVRTDKLSTVQLTFSYTILLN